MRSSNTLLAKIGYSSERVSSSQPLCHGRHLVPIRNGPIPGHDQSHLWPMSPRKRSWHNNRSGSKPNFHLLISWMRRLFPHNDLSDMLVTRGDFLTHLFPVKKYFLHASPIVHWLHTSNVLGLFPNQVNLRRISGHVVNH